MKTSKAKKRGGEMVGIMQRTGMAVLRQTDGTLVASKTKRAELRYPSRADPAKRKGKWRSKKK